MFEKAVRQAPFVISGSNATITDLEVKLSGSATAYKDISYSMAIERVGGTTSLDPFIGDFRAYTLDVAANDWIEYSTIEVPHEWIDKGSQIDNHLHWCTGNGEDVDDRYVKFQIQGIAANMSTNGTTPIEPNVSIIDYTTVYSGSAEFLIPAGIKARTHFYGELPKIFPVNMLAMGAQIKILVRRLAATSGSAPTNKPFILQFGQHIEVDSFGSSTEYTK